ncbi:hypothetical protein EJA70_28800, partial [Pseudomonas sp. PB103]|uniref:hypothetical protein n=1 Tax=Pseudomonas sp. PB103 TaxID=2494698 RepID=UPI00131ADC93
VVWSFQRQLDPNHPWHKLSSVGFPYFESMGFKELLKSVEKVDVTGGVPQAMPKTLKTNAYSSATSRNP